MVLRALRVLAVVGLAALLVAAGWWAGRTALDPPADPLVAAEPVTYRVVTGTVGRSLRLTIVAEWQLEDLAPSSAVGTVTSVAVSDGDEVSAGDTVYTVDLRPIVAAVGAVPAFRDLSLGSQGPDVAQLQILLAEEGFYSDESDGEFGRGTLAAVRRWQESLGLNPDGVVRQQDVLFLPDLPSRVVRTESIRAGMLLSGGEVTLRRIDGDPTFWIPLSPDQRGLIPRGAEVRIFAGDVVWRGFTTDVVEAETELTVSVASSTTNPICAPDCRTAVPFLAPSNMDAEVVLIPDVTGPVVPLAAVQTTPEGQTVVQRVDGSRVAVQIRAVADGIAAVVGIDPGEELALPTWEAGT